MGLPIHSTFSFLTLLFQQESYDDIVCAYPTLDARELILMNKARYRSGRAVRPACYRAWIATFLHLKATNESFVAEIEVSLLAQGYSVPVEGEGRVHGIDTLAESLTARE